MRTRGRPSGDTWPEAGPLLHERPAGTQAIEKQSHSSTLSVNEKLHFKHCGHHFGTRPLLSWERTVWRQRGARKHNHSLRARCAATLRCGHRCGRPLVRTDMRDERWYCDGHKPKLPACRILRLPGEIRNKIYEFAVRPFIGLLPPNEESGMWLLGANKQIRNEVASVMYGMKPLRLQYDDIDLSINSCSLDWDGEEYKRDDLPWQWINTAPLQFFGKEAFEYVNDIEISMDTEDLEMTHYPVLLALIDALRNRRITPLRRLTIKLLNKKPLTNEQEFVHFLNAFREIPGFENMQFEAEKGAEQLLQRAYTIRDGLLPGQEVKFEQSQGYY
jgi:hypothetical protein